MPATRFELLKLKYDMVYRKLDRPTAQTQFQEKTNAPAAPAVGRARPPQ